MWYCFRKRNQGQIELIMATQCSLTGWLGHISKQLGPVSIQRPSFPGMGIPMLKVRPMRIVQDSLYHNMDTGTMWHCALVACTPSHSIGLFMGYALFWYWVALRAPFTISLIKFYFIMFLIMIVVIIVETSMAILFILNYTLGIL